MSKLLLIIDASSSLNFNTLTKHRSPSAIPIFSKYRIIDFSLTAAYESNVSDVGVFLSNNYRSLQDHIGSGERYNLNRRKDGIFILPPKAYSPEGELYISFQKMSEQLEFFKRAEEEYSLIIPETLVWFPDFNELLKEHIRSEADISEIVSNNKERLYSFIIKKNLLIEYINQYHEIPYRNIVEVFDYSNRIKKNTITYNENSFYLRNVDDYYNLQMNFLKSPNINNIYKELFKLRTKEQLDSPSYFGENSKTINSMVAHGSRVLGTIKNSFISRNVIIDEGAVVENSIILNNTVVNKNAIIKNAILDKETIVKEGTIIDSDQLFLSEKKQVVSTSNVKKVCMLSAEISPYIKRGGLADQVGSLASELSLMGTDIISIVPLYKEIRDKYSNELILYKTIDTTIDNSNYKIDIYRIEKSKLTYYFIDLYMFFERDNIYGYQDDPYRFLYFTKVALEFLEYENIDIDIFHIHDWHLSLLPLFKEKHEYFKNTKVILTIHNLNYKGEAPSSIIKQFDLNYNIESKQKIFFLEIGITTVNEIITVSKTYAEELKYEFYSGNLKDSIIRRKKNLYGIVNGLPNTFDPSKDLSLKVPYNVDNYKENKLINKKYLCEISNFEYRDDMFIISMVSRINDTKGFDLVIDSLYTILENKNIYFVILGIGDEYLMDALRVIENKYNKQVKLFLDYNGTNPSYLYSGADLFLMPSKIEPCGIAQMIALKYGTIPLVRQTGGLNDTVTQFDNTTKKGNGFKFYNIDSREIIRMVNIAYELYSKDKDSWNQLIKNAMESNYSLKECAMEYLNIYNLEGDK